MVDGNRFSGQADHSLHKFLFGILWVPKGDNFTPCERAKPGRQFVNENVGSVGEGLLHGFALNRHDGYDKQVDEEESHPDGDRPADDRKEQPSVEEERTDDFFRRLGEHDSILSEC